MGDGTEAFAHLGKHCEKPDCHQLDFLPFTCDGCKQVFCLEHRSFRSHDCPKPDNKSQRVIVCEKCTTAVETTGEDEEGIKMIIEKHEKSQECDVRKKKKPICPVRRCRQALTFANSSTCKSCQIKVCLKHRFPADHSCQPTSFPAKAAMNRLVEALGSRNEKDCAKGGQMSTFSTPPAPSVKAC